MIGYLLLLTALAISVVDSTYINRNHLSKAGEIHHSSGQKVHKKHDGEQIQSGSETSHIGKRALWKKVLCNISPLCLFFKGIKGN
ncbi:unnamed protein product [Trichobilharzia szidati]|nr:unnamed protein product [Trichobilharzia szidati]